MTMEQQVANINQQIDHLLNGLGNEGLLDDQFAQLMQLQVRVALMCFRPDRRKA